MMRPLLPSILLLFLLLASHARAHTPEHPQPTVRKGKDLAVFIANNAYQHWEKLNYPIREAEAIAGELAQNFDFDTLVLRNKSRKEILDQITLLSNRLSKDPDAQLLLFFSGHGYYEERLCEGFFIPKDGLSVRDDPSGSSWIEYESLRKKINLLPCRHIMVALDACFAGTFDAAMTCNKSKGDTDDERDVTKRDERQLLIDDLLKGESRILFSAAGKEPKSDRSDFARRFLDALQKGCNKEGHLTADDLRRNWLQYAVPKPRLTQFGADTEGRGFVFVRKQSATDVLTVGDPDQRAIELARRKNTEQGWQDYLNNWAGGRFRTEATQELNRAQEDRIWKDAQQKNTAEAMDDYIAVYCPGGRYCTQAEMLKRPSDDGFVLVKGGRFTMGSPINEKGRDYDECQHEVAVSDFYIAKYEVTQQLWGDIMGWNPSYRHNCPQCPVDQVRWNDIPEFLKKLNAKYPDKNYRLPTEAEWEYAARGGQSSKGFVYAGSNNLKKVGWYYTSKNYDSQIVGQKNPNELGLYDMSGNVWEWCSDWYDYTYPSIFQTDPKGSYSGIGRVARGGASNEEANFCRVSARLYCPPDTYSYSRDEIHYYFIGFRLARTP